MFCPKCGEILRDNALRCPVCGASQIRKTGSQINDPCDCSPNRTFSSRSPRPQTHSTYPSGGKWKGKTFQYGSDHSQPAAYRTTRPTSRPSVSKRRIIRDFFLRFRDFSGRSSRAEFWWSYLFIIFVTVALCSVSDLNESLFESLFMFWFLITLVPLIALHIRRLHDVGRSGWWMLTSSIPVVGIGLAVLLCMPSQRRTNRWGPCPIPY